MAQFAAPASTFRTMSIKERLEEGMREVGVLLIAFAPLDAFMKPGEPTPWGILVFFVVAGILLFWLALVLEWRRTQ